MHRRTFLATSLAAVVCTRITHARESMGEVVRLDPRLDALIGSEASIEKVAGGFDWAEGPIWQKSDKRLLFSDIPKNMVWQWSASGGLKPSRSRSVPTALSMRSVNGAVAPDALVQLARESGLESLQPTPQCMASRRVSEPGVTREVYFLRFGDAAFTAFRQALAARLGTGGFEPAALSPVVIIAATDANFGSWLPLQGEPTQDCLAPLELQ